MNLQIQICQNSNTEREILNLSIIAEDIFQKLGMEIIDCVGQDTQIDYVVGMDLTSLDMLHDMFPPDIIDDVIFLQIQENVEMRYHIDRDQSRFWIVMKRDDALLGLQKGKKIEQTISGPIFDREVAYNNLARLSRITENSWFTVIQSPTKPPTKETNYIFTEQDC